MQRSSSFKYALLGLVVGLAGGFAGCGETENDAVEPATSALTVPVPTVNQYVVLANHGASFDDRSNISGGDLGVAPSSTTVLNTLTAGFDARVGVGEVLLAQRIVLRDRAVAGEIGATVVEAPRATTGPRSAFVAPPALPTPGSFTAGTTAVDVPSGQTRMLAPGKYGLVTVNGTLNLSGGLYELRDLRLGNDARVVALARSTVRITGGLGALDRASLAPASPLRAGDLRVVVAGTIDANNTALSWGNDGRMTALVVARGIFRAGDRFIASGAIAAQDVILGHDTRLTFDVGFECSTGASCDDHNPCTVDACSDAQCTHTPVAEGTSCSDGNACTQADSCRAGVCTPGTAVVCMASDQCHVAGVCNPATGVCSNPTKPDGATCNDGNECTQPDRCMGGMCVGTPVPNCPALQADLAVMKVVSNSRPSVGDTITFTVTVRNNGPAGATGVQVTDLLPAGLTFISATTSAGSYNSATGLWTVGTIPAGGTQTLQLTARVVSPSPQTNTATITHADQTDPNAGNNMASVTETPQQADLALTKTVSNATPDVGDTITFAITLVNNGPDAATNVQVTDLLPAGLTFISATTSAGSYNSATGLWTVGTVAPGSPQTLQLTARVVSPNPQTNAATISHSDQFDPNTANNTATATESPQQADLALTKTVDDPTAGAGAVVTFTITLTNNGPGTATGVQVTDPLPAGLAFIAATPSAGSYNSTTGVWSVGTVAPGGTQTLQLTATVVSASLPSNTATITHADQFDPNTANNTASTNAGPQQADLAVTKTVSNATPQVGDTITFTVTLSNNGPAMGTGVQVTDLLPAGLTLISATASAGSYSSTTGLWDVGTVSTGSPQTLQLTARVVSANAQTNTATVSHSDQLDPNAANNTASATETAQQADLALTKTVDDPAAGVGAVVTFTITLTNNGPGGATSVQVTDQLPAGLTLISGTLSQGSFTISTGIWDVGTVAAGASATLTLTAEVVSPTPQTNTATITHADQFDPNTANNSASATEAPQPADLALTKTVNNSTPSVGDTVTFTVILTNNGPGGATSVQVTDQLPAGLTLISGTLSQGSFTISTGIWDVGTVAAGASATLTLTAQVVSPDAQANTATITHADQFDPNTANNTASATEAPQPADLALTKTVNNPTPSVGDTITFTVLLSNNGPGAATGVQVTDLLPAGLALISGTLSQGSFSISTGIWNVGTLAAGASATLTLTAQVVNPTAPQTNTATITHSDQFDPNTANNTASATETPQPADLALTKTVNNPSPSVGDAVTFTVILSNHGPGTATGVEVTDQLPAGLTLISGTLSQGSFTISTGIWNVGALASGASATLTLTAQVASPNAATNTATVTHADQFDPNTANNTASATETPLPADPGAD